MDSKKKTPGCKNLRISKEIYVDIFFWQNLSLLTIQKPSLGSCELPKKFGPDRFSRFNFHLTQTDRQKQVKVNQYFSMYIVQ